MSIAAMAVIMIERRPQYMVARYIFCHSRSCSSAFSPMSRPRNPVAMLWLKGASMQALTISGDESASPMPSRPLSVWTRTRTESWLLAVLASTLGMRRIWQMISVIFMDFHVRWSSKCLTHRADFALVTLLVGQLRLASVSRHLLDRALVAVCQ